jgi:hypothetical protein
VQNHFLPMFAGSAPSRQDLNPRPYAFPCPSERLHVRRLGPLLLLFALGLTVYAQEFVPEHVVFPITDFKPDIKHLAPFSMKFGTGFCLDPDCRFVGTNYHVAKVMGKYVRIKGVFSAHRYLDSGPDDSGAQHLNLSWGESLNYTPAHDLAIYEMRHPVKQYHGVGFETEELGDDTEADIYAYPFDGNPKRGLVHWHGRYIGESPDGLLAFSYEEGRVRCGSSGGIVVDSKTKKIVGILNGVGEGKDRIALAVPVKELSDFVTKAQPYLQATLFPKTVFISPVAADLYQPYDWPENETTTFEVAKLRFIAQHLADSMRNFIATQTFAWGHDNREPDYTDAYETQILDGSQRWRRSDSKNFRDEVPFPPLNGSIVPGGEWSWLPELLGTELGLKIHQAPDAIVGGRTIHVFQYTGKAEEKVCPLRSWMVLWSITKFYDCRGEVWVDDSWTILRISQALDLSGPWYRWRGVVTYGWLEKDGRQYLVPVTSTTQAEHGKTYWCRGLFMDYELFGVRARLVLPTERVKAHQSSLGAQ